MKLKKRRDNLRAVERILLYLESEIRYRYSTIPEAFGNAAKKADMPFKRWLLFLADKLGDEEANENGFYEIWCNSLVMLEVDTFLSESDIACLIPIGQTLGYLDIDSQRAGLKLEIDNIHGIITECNNNLLCKMKVSVISGAVFGILVVIVLI